MKLYNSILFALVISISFSAEAKEVCFDSTLSDSKAKTKSGKKRFAFMEKVDTKLRCAKKPIKDQEIFGWYGTGFLYLNSECKEHLVLELIIPNYDEDSPLVSMKDDKATIKKIKKLGFKEFRIRTFSEIELPDNTHKNYDYIFPLHSKDWSKVIESNSPKRANYKLYKCD